MNTQSAMPDSRVLVTGASGFIGSHLVDALLELGCEVHVQIRETSNRRWLSSPEIQFHNADLSDPGPLENTIASMDYIFHCAGVTKAKTRSGYFSVNAEYCEPFYQLCLDTGKNLKSIVHLSSLAAVGPCLPGEEVNEKTPCNPLTLYGKSKLAGEEVARHFASKIPILILRPPVVYGPREENFYSFIKLLNNGWALQVGRTERKLSLIYVSDMVNAMLKGMTPDLSGGCYFTTDGEEYSWGQVYQTAEKLLGIQSRTLRLPESLFHLGAVLSEGFSWFAGTVPLLDKQRVKEIRQSAWTASTKKFMEDYGYQPQYDLHSGLKQTLEWYKSNQWL